jgi:hypothetical protein
VRLSVPISKEREVYWDGGSKSHTAPSLRRPRTRPLNGAGRSLACTSASSTNDLGLAKAMAEARTQPTVATVTPANGVFGSNRRTHPNAPRRGRLLSSNSATVADELARAASMHRSRPLHPYCAPNLDNARNPGARRCRRSALRPFRVHRRHQRQAHRSQCLRFPPLRRQR